MKRNPSGINLDQGLPLKGKWEFDNLFIQPSSTLLERFRTWFYDENGPLYFGGQIGTGKSTLIQHFWLKESVTPDFSFHFDREGDNLSIGDFWRIVLAEFIEYLIKNGINGIDPSFPRNISSGKADSWEKLLQIFKPKDYSFDLYTTRKLVHETIVERVEDIEQLCLHCVEKLKTHLGRNPIFFASGIDKFSADSAAFMSLKGPVGFLKKYHTLFELNLTHLFNPLFTGSFKNSPLLYVMDEDQTRTLLTKRMGVYAKPAEETIDEIVNLSGGNPRQAISLLSEFHFTDNKLPVQKRLINALKTVYLNSFFSQEKPDTKLMAFIQKKGFIDPDWLNLPGDKETALQAVYGNWVVIKGINANNLLDAAINPVIIFSIPLQTDAQEYEYRFLEKYAREAGISSYGLDLPADGMTSEALWRQVQEEGMDSLPKTNLSELVSILSVSLLSVNRNDRIIIVYSDEKILEATRALLVAKANTYEYQTYHHFDLKDDREYPPCDILREKLDLDTAVLSVNFIGDVWEKQSLVEIEKLRDLFAERQLLWWIPEKNLNLFLSQWVQLRQLFKIFVLEDELLNNLSEEEILADIEFFKDLATDENPAAKEVVGNSKILLELLNKLKTANQ
ncbi:MAG: hypothetical protein JW913_20925 [Chitinispirillaceae bacterium]|nr:hypothetical protein [Chitinispirillaceae bacterium]